MASRRICGAAVVALDGFFTDSVTLLLFEGNQVSRMEFFGPDDLEAAAACFEELTS